MRLVDGLCQARTPHRGDVLLEDLASYLETDPESSLTDGFSVDFLESLLSLLVHLNVVQNELREVSSQQQGSLIVVLRHLSLLKLSHHRLLLVFLLLVGLFERVETAFPVLLGLGDVGQLVMDSLVEVL